MVTAPKVHSKNISKKLRLNGLRSTKQRLSVYHALLEKNDHPTADDIFSRTRSHLPSISFATVYNCLETFVSCGLVRKVNIERESSRYCPNLSPHAHFKCSKTGKITDINLDDDFLRKLRKIIPSKFKVDSFELSLSGTESHS